MIYEVSWRESLGCGIGSAPGEEGAPRGEARSHISDRGWRCSRHHPQGPVGQGRDLQAPDRRGWSPRAFRQLPGVTLSPGHRAPPGSRPPTQCRPPGQWTEPSQPLRFSRACRGHPLCRLPQQTAPVAVSRAPSWHGLQRPAPGTRLAQPQPHSPGVQLGAPGLSSTRLGSSRGAGSGAPADGPRSLQGSRQLVRSASP